MYSILPPSSEPLVDIAVTLGLLSLTFCLLLGIPLFATARTRMPGYDDETASRETSGRRSRRR